MSIKGFYVACGGDLAIQGTSRICGYLHFLHQHTLHLENWLLQVFIGLIYSYRNGIFETLVVCRNYRLSTSGTRRTE
jgi:hypothetical protein